MWPRLSTSEQTVFKNAVPLHSCPPQRPPRKTPERTDLPDHLSRYHDHAGRTCFLPAGGIPGNQTIVQGASLTYDKDREVYARQFDWVKLTIRRADPPRPGLPAAGLSLFACYQHTLSLKCEERPVSAVRLDSIEPEMKFVAAGSPEESWLLSLMLDRRSTRRGVKERVARGRAVSWILAAVVYGTTQLRFSERSDWTEISNTIRLRHRGPFIACPYSEQPYGYWLL